MKDLNTMNAMKKIKEEGERITRLLYRIELIDDIIATIERIEDISQEESEYIKDMNTPEIIKMYLNDRPYTHQQTEDIQQAYNPGYDIERTIVENSHITLSEIAHELRSIEANEIIEQANTRETAPTFKEIMEDVKELKNKIMKLNGLK